MANRLPDLLADTLRRAAFLSLVLPPLVVACSPSDGGRTGWTPSASEWAYYGGDQGGMRYSALEGVHRGNVGDLQVAWTWATGDVPVSGPFRPIPGQDVRAGNFEATPLVIGDTMVVSTPFNRVVALDAATGQKLWEYDPGTVDWGRPPNGTGLVHRGVAVWSGAGGRKIFLNTRWRLIALDFATGMPVADFGYRGEVDLTEKLLWKTNRLHYTQTSPPVVFGDLVIVGNGVWDGFVYPQDPPGNIQAFDVRTGALAWSFNPIPQEGEPGNETWEDGSWRVKGHTNAWAPMTVDEERGLLYVPMGTPSGDYYGGDRKGNNLFAETLLCLDARTGERVWHFQTVHHGLWDYDLPGPPVLYTATVDGRSVDAVAIAGKTGFVYAFDRVTGTPVWPIEERPVPASDVPGERASPTQPFPTRPPAFSRQGLAEDGLVSLTPELNRKARELVRGLRLGPLFTPPSLKGTLGIPGIIGGGNWGGSAVDPATGYLYVKSSESPALFKLAPGDTARVVAAWDIDREARGLTSVDGVPIIDPPYGTVTAIDMNRGEIVWQSPVGDDARVRANPLLAGVALPERLGVSGAPGPIVTRSGLVFVAGGANVLTAFDAATGERLWEGPLPARGYANPMTYATRDGRQYVVVATGGGADGGTLVAFALPAGGSPP
ncbi:MAG: pyrroloquinoline quinone-dependent dehydrogenase [Longimicrobiales bacterium]|nr:pyrroloquinoline quinone-dependent dehydrogenase [Longimicrobiales bacterium]